MSAETNAIGAIPYNYQPIPIHSNEHDRDFVLAADGSCSKYYPHAKDRLEDPEMKNLSEFYNPNYKTAANLLGLNESEITNLNDIW